MIVHFIDRKLSIDLINTLPAGSEGRTEFLRLSVVIILSILGQKKGLNI